MRRTGLQVLRRHLTRAAGDGLPRPSLAGAHTSFLL